MKVEICDRCGKPGDYPECVPQHELKPALSSQEARIKELEFHRENLAVMLRRILWQIKKEPGDSSLKVLAGKASGLLEQLGLQGNPLRDEARQALSPEGEQQASQPHKPMGRASSHD